MRPKKAVNSGNDGPFDTIPQQRVVEGSKGKGRRARSARLSFKSLFGVSPFGKLW